MLPMFSIYHDEFTIPAKDFKTTCVKNVLYSQVLEKIFRRFLPFRFWIEFSFVTNIDRKKSIKQLLHPLYRFRIRKWPKGSCLFKIIGSNLPRLPLCYNFKQFCVSHLFFIGERSLLTLPVRNARNTSGRSTKVR